MTFYGLKNIAWRVTTHFVRKNTHAANCRQTNQINPILWMVHRADGLCSQFHVSGHRVLLHECLHGTALRSPQLDSAPSEAGPPCRYSPRGARNSEGLVTPSIMQAQSISTRSDRRKGHMYVLRCYTQVYPNQVYPSFPCTCDPIWIHPAVRVGCFWWDQWHWLQK